jgi:hypothetical protein
MLVHFHADVVGTYLGHKPRIFKTGDCAPFHHSNYTENPERSSGQNPDAHVHMTPAVFKSPSNGDGARLGILRTARATRAECSPWTASPCWKKPEPHAGGSDSPRFDPS